MDKTRKVLFNSLIIFVLITTKVQANFTDGVHYQKLDSPIEKLSDTKKIELIELFWYGCPHCFEFEPFLKKWVTQNKDIVTLVQVPAVFSKNWVPHAKAFYSAYNINHFDTLHQGLFAAIHVDRKKIYTKSKLIKFASDLGIPEDKFKKAYSSFKTELQVKKATTITSNSGIRGVPAVVIGGVYTTSPRMAGSYVKLIEVIDYLVQKTPKN